MDFPIEDVVKNFRYVLDAIKRVTGNVKMRDPRDEVKRKGTSISLPRESLHLTSRSDPDNEGYSEHEECSGNTNIRLLGSL